MTLIDKACWERGCACYDDRVDEGAVKVVLAQPEQEPVIFYRCNGCGHAYEQVHPTSCDCMEAGGFDRVEYYTTPPAQPAPLQKPVTKVTVNAHGAFCTEVKLGELPHGEYFLYTTPPQRTKQEPVAWMDVNEKGAIYGLRYWSEPDNRHEIALYTTPPPVAEPHKRTWVGLTDEEMHACWDSPLTPLGMKHARMIEAKLRSKNEHRG